MCFAAGGGRLRNERMASFLPQTNRFRIASAL
jgi:hypothetical protein